VALRPEYNHGLFVVNADDEPGRIPVNGYSEGYMHDAFTPSIAALLHANLICVPLLLVINN